MRKKLLLISTMYPSKKHPYFGIFIENQVQQLEKEGYDIDLLVIKEPRMGKINLIKKYGLWFIQWLYYLIIKGRKYDVVHAHYTFPSGLLAMAFKVFYKIPYVVTVHGGDIDKMAKINAFTDSGTRKILHSANFVITVGELLKKRIIEDYEVEASKISVMSMGVNRKIFYPQSPALCREALGLSKDKKIILFVGNIVEQKGVQELIKAYVRMDVPKAELHLVGAIKQPAFYKKIDKFIDHNNIFIHPPAQQKEIAQWMNAADILVIPSHIEGFGLVALEAMACKTPVLGTKVGGLQFLLDKNAGVLVEPRNENQLMEKMEELLQNKKLQQTSVMNGEKKVDENDQNKLIKNLILIYQTNNTRMPM